jgi:hypothetical protein
MANFGVMGPYSFEDGHAVSVTSAQYVEISQNFLTPELSHHGTELSLI